MIHYRRRKKPIKVILLMLVVFVVIIGLNIIEHNESRTLAADDTSSEVSSQSDEALKKVTKVSSPSQTYRIAIDPGHGGSDPGAIGVSGAYEKEFNLSLAQVIYEALEADPMFEPYMTRENDEYIGLNERAAMANAWNADALISIHANTYTDSTVTGTETIYRQEGSKALAEIIQRHLTQDFGLRDRGIKQERMHVLSTAKMPAVLIELGYLTNAQEENRLRSKEGQELAARAIINGLKEFLMQSTPELAEK